MVLPPPLNNERTKHVKSETPSSRHATGDTAATKTFIASGENSSEVTVVDPGNSTLVMSTTANDTVSGNSSMVDMCDPGDTSLSANWTASGTNVTPDAADPKINGLKLSPDGFNPEKMSPQEYMKSFGRSQLGLWSRRM